MNGFRLLVVTDAVGGVWAYSLELARALERLGIETVLAVSGPSADAGQHQAAAGVRLIDTALPLEWLATSEDEIARASEALARIARNEGADIIQTSSAALLASGAFAVPCVAVQHSCVASWWAAVRGTPLPRDFQWRRDLVKRGLQRADAVVAPTRAFAEASEREYGIHISAVHNGRSRREMRELPQGDFVLTAGRLWDEGKNAATLDRAAARIEAPIQAAGPTSGPNGAIARFDHLRMLGELAEDRLGGLFVARPIYASAALYEPFGLSVLEAAQAGCALVLSNIRTHRELWDDAAIFIEPRDDEAFAAAINRLIEDRALRTDFGERARKQARQYAPDRMAAEMMQIYARVMQPQLIAGAA